MFLGLYNKNMGSMLRNIYTSDCTLKLYATAIKNQNVHETHKVGKGCKKKALDDEMTYNIWNIKAPQRITIHQKIRKTLYSLA